MKGPPISMLIITAETAPSRMAEVPPREFSQLVIKSLMMPMTGLMPHMNTPITNTPPSG